MSDLNGNWSEYMLNGVRIKKLFASIYFM